MEKSNVRARGYRRVPRACTGTRLFSFVFKSFCARGYLRVPVRVPEHACFHLFSNHFSLLRVPEHASCSGTRTIFGAKSWKSKHLDALGVVVPFGLYNIKRRGLGDELGQGFDIVLGARTPNGQSEKPQKLYVRHSVDFLTLAAQLQDNLDSTSPHNRYVFDAKFALSAESLTLPLQLLDTLHNTSKHDRCVLDAISPLCRT